MELQKTHTFRNLIAVIAILAVAGGLAWLGRTQQGKFFLASISGGGVLCQDPDFDPLVSGEPCNDQGSSMLVVGGGPGLYHWYVEPVNTFNYKILKNPTSGDVNFEFFGAGDTMQVVAPQTNPDPAGGPFPKEYKVHGCETNATSCTRVFTVKLVPACVESLQFVTPSGSAQPQEGKVMIEKIRENLSNGCYYEHDKSDISSLDLGWLLGSETGSPPVLSGKAPIFQEGGILLQNEHGNMKLRMTASGDDVAPARATDTLSDPYDLHEGTVYPDTLNVTCENPAVKYLQQGVDYNFVPGSPSSLLLTNAGFTLCGAAPTLAASYAYRLTGENARKVTADLSIPETACYDLFASILTGEGQGLYTGTIDEAACGQDPIPQGAICLPTAAKSVPFEFGKLNVAPMSSASGNTIDFSQSISLAPDIGIRLQNPIATGTSSGSRKFTMAVTLDASLATDFFLGGATANTYTYSLEIKKKTDDADTASHFKDAITAIPYSPFAATHAAGSAVVTLKAIEKGAYTNNYTGFTAISCAGRNVSVCSDVQGCSWNDQAILVPACEGTGQIPIAFTGGKDGELSPINSITLSAPSAGYGKNAFVINMKFVPGLQERAVLDSAVNGTYEIRVRSEGTDAAATASNFAYVFNSNLLKTDSPFYASPSKDKDSDIILTARELGLHTNNYNCTINGISAGPGCFTGAKDGTGAAAKIVNQPLTEQSTLAQGDTALVYAKGGYGKITWRSLSPGLLKAESLAETSQTNEPGAVTFMPTPIIGTPNTPVPMLGNVKCEDKVTGEGANAIADRVCTFDVSTSITYPAQGTQAGYTAKVKIGAKTYNVYLSSSEISGKLTATGLTYSKLSGFTGDTLTGKVTGYMSGVVSGGEAVGGVDGPVESDVSVSLGAILAGKSGVVVGDLTLNSVTAIGNLKVVGGGFASTVRIQDIDVTTYAKLTALCPTLDSPAILTLTDSMGCVTSLRVTVQPRKIEIKADTSGPYAKDLSDILDAGDMFQMKAYLGDRDVTREVVWSTSDPKVATITSGDNGGLAKIVGLGEDQKTYKASITAALDKSDECTETAPKISQAITLNINKISSLALTLDNATLAKLSKADREKAYKSVGLMVHSPLAIGTKILIEGREVPVVFTDDPASPAKTGMDKIKAIMHVANPALPPTGLKDTLAISTSINNQPRPLVEVQSMENAGYPGVLILTPTSWQGDGKTDVNGDGKIDPITENGIVDIQIVGSDKKNIMVRPQLGLLKETGGINLPPAETFTVDAAAFYDNGRTKYVEDPIKIKWSDTPYVMDKFNLDAGILKRGQGSGPSWVSAEYEGQTDGFYVTVPSGPVISEVTRVGTGPIKRGSTLRLKVKVSDVDTIKDITRIDASLVRSAATAYDEIVAGPTDWFITKQVVYELKETVETPPVEDKTGDAGASNPPAPPVNPPANPPAAESQALPYKIYDVTLKIPDAKGLSDGWYKVIITAYDAEHEAHAIYPIYIGEKGSGDVYKDSRLNRYDIFMTLLLANGRPIPPAFKSKVDKNAADMDGNGVVNLSDLRAVFMAVQAAGVK